MVRRLRTLWPLWLVMVGLLVVVLLVFLPPLLVGPYGLKDPEKRLAAENALRATLAAALGGMAVIAGAVVGALNFRETSRQNRATSEQNRAVLELQRRGQVTERFSKAIEQLGQSDKVEVRIGAVYALEQIAQDSPELHWPIMEVLTACLREQGRLIAPVAGTNAHGGPEPRITADAQAIATVIGRRRQEHDRSDQRLDLRGVYLSCVRWEGAQLKGADLTGAELVLAKLGEAQLEGADLRFAQLKGADLTGAALEGSSLEWAQLQGTRLTGAQLKGADLR